MGRHKSTIGETQNYHIILDSHRCTVCGRGKTETNFSVNKMINGNYNVRRRCNLCRHVDMPEIIKAKKLSIKEKIDVYFKEQYV